MTNNSTNNGTNNGKKTFCTTATVTLPTWAIENGGSDYYSRTYRNDEDMMMLAIELSSRNVKEGTGGPFGAAVFKRNIKSKDQIDLVSIGVNRVVPLHNSTLHGEMVAIQLAQNHVQSFALRCPHDEWQYELFTSCEPCCMCLGATLWSGVSRLVCGATKADAKAIGFDEGPVYEESYDHLKRAGMTVTRGVLTKRAAQVLREYGESGTIYNAR